MACRTVKRLTKPLDEPERECQRRRKAALCSHQNETLPIAERNLFDDEASSSHNTGAKPPTPPKTLQEHSHPNSSADGATRDTSRLRFFHISLKGKAAEWLDRIPPTQITTWEQLVSRFFNHFFLDDRRKLNEFAQFHFNSLNEDEGWNRIEEYVQYQDDLWDDVLKKQKKDDEDEQLLSIFKQIHINLSFLEAMIHMPKGAKVLKDLLSHKEKFKKSASSVKLSEECFAVIQRSLPQKEGDPGSFTLPCLIGPLAVKNTLADLGTSINLMPHSLFQRLGISKHKPTKISIQLADRSIKYPIEVCENLLVKISKFIFLVDFIVLEMDEDELVLIILGRPFLATAKAVIDVHKGKLSLRVRSETVTFNIGKSMKSKHSHDDYLYCADHTAKLVQEQWVDIVNHDREWTKEEEGDDPNKVLAVSFYLRTEPVELLEWKALKNQLKPSSVKPPKLELKELPKYLEYAFLQENNQLLVVISSALSTVKKTRLLEVLRNHKGAIA
ncbi:DNA-directed DNA polymerase [Tanacetum coccineum]